MDFEVWCTKLETVFGHLMDLSLFPVCFFPNLASYMEQGMNHLEDTRLFEQIKNSDEKAFERFFHRYYGYLCAYATKLLHNNHAAEEIVQDFFVKLWEKRHQLHIETSVKNYLFRSVKNLCLNYLKHGEVKLRHTKLMLSNDELESISEDVFMEPDLALKIEESILSLPEKRQEIFRLSREEGLKYREIAEKLNISIKTVEAQMSLAIKYLRDKLKQYSTFFTFFLSIYKK